MVPLLAIGTGQVADARKLCPGIMAFHVDELSRADFGSLMQVNRSTSAHYSSHLWPTISHKPLWLTRAPGPYLYTRPHLITMSHHSGRCCPPSSPGRTRRL